MVDGRDKPGHDKLGLGMTTEALTADEVIAHLGLKPHPEGGWYRETFRDEPGHKGRAHSTAMLFLLKTGEVSRWHRGDAVEMFHWYGGAPLLLEVKDDETRHEYRLGSNLLAGEHPQALVPKGAWQTARSLGAWTLVGCTVAPGFEFSGFEIAPEGFEP
jgi:predicted cupin superfamily sugar epimerase